jgi:hypothetical protein
MVKRTIAVDSLATGEEITLDICIPFFDLSAFRILLAANHLYLLCCVELGVVRLTLYAHIISKGVSNRLDTLKSFLVYFHIFFSRFLG